MQGLYHGHSIYGNAGGALPPSADLRSTSHHSHTDSNTDARWKGLHSGGPAYHTTTGWGARLGPQAPTSGLTSGLGAASRAGTHRHPGPTATPMSPDEEVAELVERVTLAGQIPEDPEIARVAQIRQDEEVQALSSFSDQLPESVGRGAHLARPIPVSVKKTRTTHMSPGGGIDLQPTELSFGPSSRSVDKRVRVEEEREREREREKVYPARYPDQSGPPAALPQTQAQQVQRAETEIASLRRQVEEEERAARSRAPPQTANGTPLYPPQQEVKTAVPLSTAPKSRPSRDRQEEKRQGSAPRTNPATSEFEELFRWRALLERQHLQLKEREEEADRKIAAARQQDTEKEWRSLQLESRERELNLREMKLQHTLDGFKSADANLHDKQQTLDAKIRDTLDLQHLLESKMQEVNQKVLDLHNREGVLEVREQVLSCREREALAKRDELEKLERLLERKLQEVQDAELSLKDWKNELSVQHHRNVVKVGEIRDDESRLSHLASELRSEQQSLESKISTLRHLERFNKPVHPQPTQPPPAQPTRRVFDLDDLPTLNTANYAEPAATDTTSDTTRVLDMDGTLDSDITSDTQADVDPVSFLRAPQASQPAAPANPRRYTGYISPDPETTAARPAGPVRSEYVAPSTADLLKDLRAAPSAVEGMAASPPPSYAQSTTTTTATASLGRTATAELFREQIIKELEKEDLEAEQVPVQEDNVPEEDYASDTDSPPTAEYEEEYRSTSEEEYMRDDDEPPASTTYVLHFLFRSIVLLCCIKVKRRGGSFNRGRTAWLGDHPLMYINLDFCAFSFCL